MKTINRTLTTTAACVAWVWLAGVASAQYLPTSDDGVTASPKVRQFLNERSASLAPSMPSNEQAMSCPKCKDEYTKRTDLSGRGATKPTVLVAKHLCAGCETTITVAGQGKAKSDVVLHKCTGCGADTLACCKTAPASKVATSGMEKKFQIAPVK